LSGEAEVTIRFSNSQCPSKPRRPFYLATALRAVVRPSGSTEQSWISRPGGVLDNSKEGEAP
jgi:hypothetical protein